MYNNLTKNQHPHNFKQNSSYNYVDMSNIYVTNLTQILDQYIEEKNNVEVHIQHVETTNINLIHYIRFLEKQCYFINITHSNTTNFILANYSSLKKLLEKHVHQYYNNLEKIEMLKGKLQGIISTIYTLKYKVL